METFNPTIELNDDILYNILLQTNINDIKSVCLSNKVYNTICKDINFWKYKFIQDGLDDTILKIR